MWYILHNDLLPLKYEWQSQFQIELVSALFVRPPNLSLLKTCVVVEIKNERSLATRVVCEL